jgi:ELWxxDGT repeat protein
VAGTRLIADLNPAGPSDPEAVGVVDDLLLFAADDGNGRALWATDGSLEGTRIVAHVEPASNALATESVMGVGPIDPSTQPVAEVGGQLFFTARDGTTGSALWVTDGTTEGTVRLARIDPAGVSLLEPVFPADLAVVGNRVLFAADDGASGRELWATDGTLLGTHRVRDIHRSGGADPELLGKAGDRLIVSANDGTRGRGLWSTDGTSEGTTFLAPVAALHASFGHSSAELGSALYLIGRDRRGRALWRTDGTRPGTRAIMRAEFEADYGTPDLLVAGRTLYLAGFARREGDRDFLPFLWASDGTARGTRLLRRVPWADSGSIMGSFAVSDDSLYFVAARPGSYNSFALWRSDGTRASTRVVVRDVNFEAQLAEVPGGVMLLRGLTMYRPAVDASEFLADVVAKSPVTPVAGWCPTAVR